MADPKAGESHPWEKSPVPAERQILGLGPITISVPKLAIPAVRRVKGPYAVMGGVPTNYVIDRAGVVRYAKAGALDLDTLNTVLIPLLNEHPPT